MAWYLNIPGQSASGVDVSTPSITISQQAVVANDFQDSIAFDTVTGGVSAPNMQAIVPLRSLAGATALDVVCYSNIIGTGSTAEFGVGVYIDGVWNSSLAPSSNGSTTYHVTLDGTPRNIDLVSGFANFKTTGNFIVSWGTNAAVRRSVAAPTRRLTVYTDSIGSGGDASPNDQNCWFAKIRGVHPGRCAMEGWGGRSLWDDGGTGGGQIGLGSLSALATRLVALGQLGSPTTREIWIQIGYNDKSANRQSAANFQTNMATLLDAINAADSAARVYLASPIITGDEAGTNTFGNTIGNYRTACSSAASGRAWVTFVDGTTLMTAGGLDVDGVHPTTAGHATMFTNIRSVLGI